MKYFVKSQFNTCVCDKIKILNVRYFIIVDRYYKQALRKITFVNDLLHKNKIPQGTSNKSRKFVTKIYISGQVK